MNRKINCTPEPVGRRGWQRLNVGGCDRRRLYAGLVVVVRVVVRRSVADDDEFEPRRVEECSLLQLGGGDGAVAVVTDGFDVPP